MFFIRTAICNRFTSYSSNDGNRSQNQLSIWLNIIIHVARYFKFCRIREQIRPRLLSIFTDLNCWNSFFKIRKCVLHGWFFFYVLLHYAIFSNKVIFCRFEKPFQGKVVYINTTRKSSTTLCIYLFIYFIRHFEWCPSLPVFSNLKFLK